MRRRTLHELAHRIGIAGGRGRAQQRDPRTADGELSPPRSYPEAEEALAALVSNSVS